MLGEKWFCFPETFYIVSLSYVVNEMLVCLLVEDTCKGSISLLGLVLYPCAELLGVGVTLKRKVKKFTLNLTNPAS